MANHPEIIKAAIKGTEKFGFGAGASRLLAGGTTLHEKLEKLLSRFKSTESSLVFNSGYSANTGMIPAIAAEGDMIFSDELNHASIIDSCRLSRAGLAVYRHKDVSELETLVRRTPARKKIIVTDSVFSMDGDIAPLREIAQVCVRQGALLYVDDAHGTGVLGQGRGALAHFGIRPEPWIIQMGTLSKALGSFGAFAASGTDTIDWLSNAARSFVYSTALPNSVVSASISAVRLVMKDKKLIKALWSNIESLLEKLRAIGYEIPAGETPIIPVLAGTVDEAIALSAFLFRRGIYAPAIRPPTVRRPRVRIVVSAAHSETQLELLAKSLADFRKKRGR